MNKLVLISVICMMAIGGSSVMAAEATWGVKMGANMSSFTGKDADNMKIKPLTKFSAGGLMMIALGNNLKVQTELNYAMKGGQLGVLDKKNFDYTYVEVPVLFKLMIPGGESSMFLMAGPYAASLLSATYNGHDMANVVTKLDYGYILGFGVEMGHLVVDARYQMGLITTDDSILNLEAMNSGYGVSVGLLF